MHYVNKFGWVCWCIVSPQCARINDYSVFFFIIDVNFVLRDVKSLMYTNDIKLYSFFKDINTLQMALDLFDNVS